VVSLAMVLFGRANFECIFGARSVDLGGFFIDMRSSVVVSGFLRSDCVKPRPWWSLLLGAWPTCTMEFSPAGLAHARGPQPVGLVVVDGDWWFRASSASEELLTSTRRLR
jgi:hypothetical protein